MPWYIKHVPYVDWDVYLVEAESETAVWEKDGERLGGFHEPSDLDNQIYGPFKTEGEALSNIKAWTE